MHLAGLFGDPRLPYSYSRSGRIEPEEREATRRVVEALSAWTGIHLSVLDDHRRLIDALRSDPPDLVINLCDNGFNNRLEREAHVPALLELLDIPFTGSSVQAISLCADKAAVRGVAASLGIPVPAEQAVAVTDADQALPEHYPVLIKPNDGCGSLGVESGSLVHNPDDARTCLERFRASEKPPAWLLIQDYLPGTEYTVGVIGNPGTGFTEMPPLAIDYSALPAGVPPILAYSAKADPASDYYRLLRSVPVPADEPVARQMIAAARTLFTRLGVRDYARVDFREDADGVPRLIDFNTQPNWSYDGKLASMAELAGYDYPGMLRRLVETACARYGIAAPPGSPGDARGP